MKALIVLAIIFAVVAVGFLISTLFTGGANVVVLSIGAGLALVAFILAFVAYVIKSPN
ncbi:MAG: hypothetical protein J6C78_04070 [Muribaculaceae bacterium]|nr:hypothetical protein [Muribaculaceae bacterium]